MSVTALPPLAARRPTLHPLALNALVATYLLAACNGTFWGHFATIFAKLPLQGLGFVVVIWALTLLVISLIAVRRAQKPVLVALLILGAVGSYYVDVLGVVIDRDMIQNAMTTNVTEAGAMVTSGLVLHVALFGLLPAQVVLWLSVRRAAPLRALGQWGLVVVTLLAVPLGILFLGYKDYAWVLRERKELLASTQPLAPLAASLRYARLMLRSSTIVVEPVGTDARPGPWLAAATKPVLMVIVAGETGRAANWSLHGYGRETNPRLAARDILYYAQATSCGTATATSLPCMFSPLPRADYSYEGGLSHENLLDVLAHAGFRVEWWDNQGGDKAVAARFQPRFMGPADGPAFCLNDGECIDGIFQAPLARLARTMTENTVVVLHQIGSHGPSYWRRYPPEAEVFTPACRTVELTDCTAEEIVNAYDNTILYTDRVLADIIDLLDAQDRVIPAMFYVSDHGESLGEGGVYLHGTPYFMAPDEQTHVPMVIWMADRFQTALGLDRDCMAPRTSTEVSHDNMFSTVIDLLNVVTTAEDEALDLADTCRKAHP